MILIGQYDSPYVRRVAVSLRVLGIAHEQAPHSVFRDFDAVREANPLGRVPALILDSGETLIESSAILDWLDEAAGPTRALLPREGAARRQALRRIGLATGINDKGVFLALETYVRPAALRWPDWIARTRAQITGALAALEAEPWPEAAPLDQVRITTACTYRYMRLCAPDLVAQGRYPALDALSRRCEALGAFAATWPADYVIPRA